MFWNICCDGLGCYIDHVFPKRNVLAVNVTARLNCNSVFFNTQNFTFKITPRVHLLYRSTYIFTNPHPSNLPKVQHDNAKPLHVSRSLIAAEQINVVIRTKKKLASLVALQHQIVSERLNVQLALLQMTIVALTHFVSVCCWFF